MFAFLDVSGHLGNIIFFSEKSNFIPYFGPGLEKKGKQISLCFWTFLAIWGIFQFCWTKIFYSSTEPGTLLCEPFMKSTAHI